VVDVHTRLEVDPGAVGSRGRTVSPDRLEREMHQAGIIRSVVFPGPRPETYLRANNAVARHAVDRPFIAFARINGPRNPAGTPVAKLKNLTATRADHHVSPDGIDRYAYDDRFHGFKLDPVTDGLPGERVLAALEEVGAPVLVHVGEGFPPEAVEATLLERALPVIMAHCGGYPLNRTLMERAIDLLARYDNCYVDTSVVRFRDVLERAMLEHPDRVLCGGGAQDVHPNVGVMEILTLDVSEDAMRKAFSKNPGRVIPDLRARPREP
jgi:predicted TIM-barrel fold metal-dependent hydrolase